MSKPRVLLLLHELSLSGAPLLAIRTFEWIGEQVDLRIVSFEGGPLEPMAEKLGRLKILLGPTHTRKNKIARKISGWLPRGAVLRASGRQLDLTGFLRKWRPDVIYINSVVSLNAARYFRLPDAPVLLNVHELQSAMQWQIGRFPHLLRDLPTSYLAGSQAVKDALVQNQQIEASRISVVYSFINPQDIEKVASCKAETDEMFVVGGCGGLVWCKGWQLWLLMAAELEKLRPLQNRFVWLGGGLPEVELQFDQTVRRLGLEHAVHRHKPTSAPLEVFRTLDAFALTSWEDSCPVVVLENMALGKVVACFAGGGGAPETVGDCGLIIDEFSPQQMAAALAQIAHDPVRRAVLEQSARTRALTHFSVDVQAARILEKIREVARLKNV